MKGVYRLTVDDGTTVIAYLWEDSENYWPQAPNANDVADPFSLGGGIDLFVTARSRLASLGLRVPEIYLLDRDRAYYPAGIAILEDFPGETLLAWWERDPAAAEPTLSRLREGLAAMRGYRGSAPGKVSFVDAGGTPRWPTSEEAVLALGRGSNRGRRHGPAAARVWSATSRAWVSKPAIPRSSRFSSAIRASSIRSGSRMATR
jgi:hypothetical protein